MNEALTQALIRLGVSGVLAFIAAILANVSILNDVIDDKVFASLVVAVITAVLSAVAKYLGGPTQAVERSVGRGAAGGVKRPNIFSV